MQMNVVRVLLSLVDELPNFSRQDCDNTIQNGAHIVDPSLCALACTGNGGEYCGAASFLAVYAFVGS